DRSVPVPGHSNVDKPTSQEDSKEHVQSVVAVPGDGHAPAVAFQRAFQSESRYKGTPNQPLPGIIKAPNLASASGVPRIPPLSLARMNAEKKRSVESVCR